MRGFPRPNPGAGDVRARGTRRGRRQARAPSRRSRSSGTSNVVPAGNARKAASPGSFAQSSPDTIVIRSAASVPKWNSPWSTTPTVWRRPFRSNPTLWTPPSKYVLCLSMARMDGAVARSSRATARAAYRRRFGLHDPTSRGFEPSVPPALAPSACCGRGEPAFCGRDAPDFCGRDAPAFCGRGSLRRRARAAGLLPTRLRGAGVGLGGGCALEPFWNVSASRGTSPRGASRVSRSIACSRSLLRRGEARGAAARRRPRGAADAVDVVLGDVRQVEVHDVTDVGDVDAAGGDVGRDEHAVGAVLEPVERHPPLRRRAVGVDPRDLVAGAGDLLPDLVRAPLRPGEHERRVRVALEQRGAAGASLAATRGTPAARRAPRSSRCAPPRRGPDRADARGRSRPPRPRSWRRRAASAAASATGAGSGSSCGLKPMSSIRSASSSTSTSMPSRSALPCARWSTSRPGVAMTISRRSRSACACPPMPTPPMITAPRTRRPWPKRSSSSPICRASSRVGARTSARVPILPASRSRIGRRNAAVLPVPVAAVPMTSRPSSAGGMACAGWG